MVASWRPDVYVGVAFNANPNDPLAIPTWTNLSTRFRTAKQVTTGRQYELDQNQASQPTMSFLDQDEALNPANTSSPFAPNVVPYRRILWMAQYPNTTSGNLLNTGYGSNPTLRTVAGYDPTFESYPLISTVPWIAAVGSTTPVVGNGAPHTGTQNLIWSTTNGAAQQGVSLKVPCIPGRQYTDSLYARQSSASTQQIGVTDQTLALDSFARTATSGWGNADVGGTWSVSGVSNSEFSVSAGNAFQSNTSRGVDRASFIGSGIRDVTVTAKATVPVVATGGPIMARVVLRRVDASNYYMLEARFNTDNSVTVQIWSVVGGVSTAIANTPAPFGYTAGTSVWLQFTGSGPNLSGVCWLDGTPASTSGATVSATDSSLTAGAAVGCHSALHSLNSNTLPVAIAFSNFSAVGTVYGTSTTTTGSYQRLTVTYTASQPTHTLQVATAGTAVAGNVLLDDLQHEEGASASAFTTTGPTIYGVLNDFVERWPSRWDYMGFLGEADLVAVDAFGPQNLTTLSTEYPNSVLAKTPDYYWPLGDSDPVIVFAEASGHSATTLTRYTQGATGSITTGAEIGIAGAPNATGVAITAPGGGAAVGTVLVNTDPNGFTAGGTNAAFGVSMSYWLLSTGPTNAAGFPVTLYQPGGAVLLQSLHQNSTFGPPFIVVQSFPPGPTGIIGTNYSGHSYNDGLPHHFAFTLNLAGGNATIRIYIDGVQVAALVQSVILSYGTPNPNLVVNTISVGGVVGPVGLNGAALYPATYAQLAVWKRALSATEIADLWNAGKGYLGETSGQRVARYLSYGWTGPTSIDAGQSIMGVSNLSAGTALLQANQDVTTSENGNYWVDGWGATTFAARTRRYLATTSLYTFGEDEASGEYPYLGDVAFDFDPTLVFNDVEVDNAGGITAITIDKASQLAYFQRAYQRQLNVQDNNEALDASRYLVNQHKDPHLRVEVITLDPASNPRLWPVVLALQIGQRVTVKRRAKAANNGVGIVISGDFFVEQKSIDSVDLRAGLWTYKLYLSPVDISQVGIVDNGTYGRLATAGAVLRDGISAAATTAVVNLTGGDLFTTSGTFQATIDSEIVTVTVVSGASSPQTLTITRPTDGTAVAHNSGAPVQVFQPFVLAY